MTVPSKTEIPLDHIVALLANAKNSLQTCLDYETFKEEYAVSSLLMHVMHCIEQALMGFDKRYYEQKQELRRTFESIRKMAQRG